MNIPYTSNPARNTMYIYPPTTIRKMHEGHSSSHTGDTACAIIIMIAVVIVLVLMIKFTGKPKRT